MKLLLCLLYFNFVLRSLALQGITKENLPTHLEVSNEIEIGNPSFILIASTLILAQALGLSLIFGQPVISKSGDVKIWEGDIFGPENSQHILDWYTSTHVIHGFISYYGTLPLPLPLKDRYLIALSSEVLWEMVENSPWIIQRYRETTMAQGYQGDSVINSVFDTVAMTLGFWMAHVLPPLLIVEIAVYEEIFLAYMIRDNLILNVIQLLYKSEVIETWQKNQEIKQKLIRNSKTEKTWKSVD